MRLKEFVLLFLILAGLSVYGQNEPIVIEAESGTLGSDYQTLTDGDVTYITPSTDYLKPASQPNDASKVASFSVIFPEAGTYKLFMRIRIGSANFDDDSFYYANGLGTKDPASGDDWITCNGLVAAGYTVLKDVVQDVGDAGQEVWKWLALSDHTGGNGEGAITFNVEAGNLTQTFEIGARENGFDVDKIAFGKEGLYYTVDNLNKGVPGSETDPSDVPADPPLADGLDKFLGCGYGSDTKRDFADYWNQVTPGNAGKWGSVESTRDNMNWTELDEGYQLAMDSGFVYKHHVMVWGSQQPDWIETLDSAEQRAELVEWFDAVADRYPGMHQVEVVNEPLHQPPSTEYEGKYIGALGGAGETGWDWIIEAFRMARTAFSDTTILMINEYGILDNPDNTDDYLEIIKLLQAEDTLIDAIGFQAHGFSQHASNEVYLRNIDTLASTGLPIYITELDIDGHTDLEQVHGYMNLFPLFWEHEAVKGITMWGYRPAMWRGHAGAYLIDDLGVERPALLWLRAYLKDEFVANESISVSTASGASTIESLGGTLQMQAEVMPEAATLQTVHWKVNNSGIATIDSEGVLTAVSNGEVTVTAMSLELGSDVEGTMTITVSGPSSINNVAENQIKVYPNPSTDGQFIIDGVKGNATLVVYDLSGRQVLNLKIIDQKISSFQLESSSGVYMMKLIDESGVNHVKVTLK